MDIIINQKIVRDNDNTSINNLRCIGNGNVIFKITRIGLRGDFV